MQVNATNALRLNARYQCDFCTFLYMLDEKMLQRVTIFNSAGVHLLHYHWALMIHALPSLRSDI